MKLGLVLGSGAARGWAHIGIIEALAGHGIRPDIITGTSIGAIVAASYACGSFESLKKAVLGIDMVTWASFFSPSASIDGWMKHRRFHEFFEECGIEKDRPISSTEIPFGCVACDLMTGHEKWFTEGSITQAIWASMALPGIFPAVGIGGHWYIDGGIINPVPVSLARALGADLVIAVNLNADILAKHPSGKSHAGAAARNFARPIVEKVVSKAEKILPEAFSRFGRGEGEGAPSALENISRSINIAQDIITRSRLAGDAPDVLMTPRLSHVGMLETYRGEEGIAEGRRCCELLLPYIEDLIEERLGLGY